MSEPSVIAALEAALCSAAPEKRSAALDRVVDLFVAGARRYTPAQIALFDEVFLKLVKDIEVKARRKLARRLAPIPQAPKNTIRRLAQDQFATVAAPVLIHAIQLEDSDLVVISRTSRQGHLYALSRRPSLNEAVTDVVLDFAGRRAARALAGNSGARLSDAAFGKLVQRAAGDDVLAQAVGARRDIPRQRFAELLLNASSAVRVKLAANAPYAAREIEEAVADALVSISQDARIVSQETDLAKAEVQRLSRTGRGSDFDTQAAARARKFDQAATALSLVCGVPFDVAERALTQEQPDMLLILAKAAGCAWHTTKALLRIRAGERAPLAEDLQQARHDFERLQTASARRLVERYRSARRRRLSSPRTGEDAA